MDYKERRNVLKPDKAHPVQFNAIIGVYSVCWFIVEKQI